MIPSANELEAQLRELEESHLRPEIRSSPDALRSLLAEDFMEIGSSGRIWNLEAVVESLAGQAPFTASIEQFSVKPLAPGVALTTYRIVVTAAGAVQRTTMRSSIWVQREGRWRLVFHQGTPAPASLPLP
jgi:hypothetical protein